MEIGNALYKLLIGPLELLFEFIFAAAYRHLNQPGLAVIVLSLAVNFLVLPLYRRADSLQAEERDKEEKLQPLIDHYKKTFSGDERFMMLQTLYRQNDYKPIYTLRGSFSLLLEIPFFIAAYHFLSNLNILNGASFGPIRDLGTPDALLNIAGISVNILPILMTLINALSAAIYMKGFPLKSKLQMYGMALIFLIFLYGSPSGLVFYWTLNNLFSLGKNIFYKLNDPRKVLRVTAITGCVLGIGALNFLLLRRPDASMRRVIIFGAGILLLLTVFFLLISKRVRFSAGDADKTDDRIFLLGCLFMVLLTGVLIPSSVIKSSPGDFVSMGVYYSPLLYVVNSLIIAAGAFGIWFGIFYRLANTSVRKVMSIAMTVIPVIAAVNYMFFGTSRGDMSSQLVFSAPPTDSSQEVFINMLVLIETACLLCLVRKTKPKAAAGTLLTFCLAIGTMSGLNVISIAKALSGTEAYVTEQTANLPEIPLNKNGKNVMILMMDRSIGYYIPFLMAERPDLQQKFDGFTFYPNTLSYATQTNGGLPPIYGGYEYTPKRMNERPDVPLVTKHNESLLMMPLLFDQNDYEVTVIEPSYANYAWVPDLSIYKDYPNINAYLANGFFSSSNLLQSGIETRNRNFFCFSLYKSAPLVMQPMLYTGGLYNDPDVMAGKTDSTSQTMHSLLTATGTELGFEIYYSVLANLPSITKISDSDKNTYLTFDNATTHDPMLLQMPDYTSSLHVNNEAFEKLPIIRRSADGRTIELKTSNQVIHYHTNMAAYLALGQWFDFLRENGVYDNTRIIIAADHGHWQGFDEHMFGPKNYEDVLSFNPVLMVKDFNSTGFTTDERFMTNAEVPTIAMNGLIESPVNPFTGNPVTDTAKDEEVHEVQYTKEWSTDINNGNTFLPSDWFGVHGQNIFECDNWEKLGVY